MMYDRDPALRRLGSNHRALVQLAGESFEIQKITWPTPVSGELDAESILSTGAQGYAAVILHGLGAQAHSLVETAVLGFIEARRDLGSLVYLIPKGHDNHPDLVGTLARVVRVRPDGYFDQDSAEAVYGFLRRL